LLPGLAAIVVLIQALGGRFNPKLTHEGQKKAGKWIKILPVIKYGDNATPQRGIIRLHQTLRCRLFSLLM
jgi:hypothetical protein